MTSSPLTGNLEFDVNIDATPLQFHHMWANKPHMCTTDHTSSEKVQGCDHEGQFGKPGVIICWRFVHDGKAKIAKQVVEEIDHDNKLLRFNVLEGNLLKDYKSFVITIQTHPKKDGKGCIAHWILEYEMLHDGVGNPERSVSSLSILPAI